jgi:hypothetical protein
MKRLLTLLVLVVALLAPAAPAVAGPVSPGAALSWVVSASHRVPISEAEQREHLSASFLSAVGGPAGFNSALASFGPLSPPRVLSTTPDSVEAVSASWLVSLSVDARGLVDSLLFRPYVAAPASWSELDSRLRTLAPEVSFGTFAVDDGCRAVHAVGGNTARPLGSAFKLYVLDALAGAVADGRTSWERRLAIRDEWKSLPTGVLQDTPAGTRLPLSEYADKMISISDNTATDHLIHFLGRSSVHRGLVESGNHARGNFPFLTTRELFALKGYRYPALAGRYLAAPPALRPALLPIVDSVPREKIQPWTAPRDIADIEWFGAPKDICRAFAGLLDRHDPAVDHALSISDGGIGLDRAEFPDVWFKGGSEPGVLTLNHLARRADGRVLVSSVLLANPAGELDSSVQAKAFALVRGGLELA